MKELLTWFRKEPRNLVAWCEDCGRWHFHGAGPEGTDPKTMLGSRAAHCPDLSKPGYRLIGGDPMPPEIERDLERERPFGPFRLGISRTKQSDGGDK